MLALSAVTALLDCNVKNDVTHDVIRPFSLSADSGSTRQPVLHRRKKPRKQRYFNVKCVILQNRMSALYEVTEQNAQNMLRNIISEKKLQ